ncbi:hypothetical protein [Cohnella silvisoli]|uniref:Alpha-L-rhamnosidase six-hairpin glycosidase domain-containing protein n=1 Tax=Cohnella silvisoli TaxID=2873699 RepID=A0ABV1L1E2_9BACL|nr:hypothetical protein [Cohnella silvisoli]MCD9025040.1 hypothetical protein [Cohnella silvisoli]
MNMLNNVGLCLSFNRAVWKDKLPCESDAPERRIIHARCAQFTSPVVLWRIGIQENGGYFKCGSVNERDWVADFRLLVRNGAGVWREVLYEMNQSRPPADAGAIWFEAIPAVEVTELILEVRRSGVDGWWPSWNLAADAFVVEGEPVSGQVSDADSMIERSLALTSCDLSALPPGVEARRCATEVRYRTRFLEMGFRLQRSGFSYLALDEDGNGNTRQSLLKNPEVGLLFSPQRQYLAQGLSFHPVGAAELSGFQAHHVEGEVTVKGNTIVYDLTMEQWGQSWRLTWEVHEDRLRFMAERSGLFELRVWKSSVWTIALDSRVIPTTVLGALNRQGETGLVTLPLLLHAPKHGTIQVHAHDDGPTGEIYWRSDAIRPIYTNLCELKVGEIPQPEGDYLLPAGRYRSSMEWRIGTPRLANAADGTPPEVERAINRCLTTALTYRADTSTFSNNGTSIHAPICMDLWSSLCVRLDPILPNLTALDLLRDTLERWLTLAPGYASGRSSKHDGYYEDEYLMTGVSSLLGLADFLMHSEDTEWMDRYRGTIELQLQLMEARDLDGDGLIESDKRQGVSGEHQWSTNWWDVISFGWKDAFVNALLYGALLKLAESPSSARLFSSQRLNRIRAWAAKLKTSYRTCFYNPQTGWFAGWRCREDRLHDYAFLFVNGAAVTAGLLDDDLSSARTMIAGLYEEMQRVGWTNYRYGVPGNLWKIPNEDMPVLMHNLPFGIYQNGGTTLSQARHFIAALYRVGMQAEADDMLTDMCASLADGSAFGGCGSGVDWRMSDGMHCGYEGLLCDQLGVLIPAIERYGS